MADDSGAAGNLRRDKKGNEHGQSQRLLPLQSVLEGLHGGAFGGHRRQHVSAIGQLRGGTILPGQDLTAALYINNLIGKSGTLKAIFKDATSDKDFAAAPAYAEQLSPEPTSAAPNLNGGIPIEYVETVERASYRHLLRVRGILAEGKARAKDSYTRNRFDYLLGLIDKSINVKDKR